MPDERARAANLVNASGVLAGLRQYDRAYDLLKAAGRSGAQEICSHEWINC